MGCVYCFKEIVSFSGSDCLPNGGGEFHVSCAEKVDERYDKGNCWYCTETLAKKDQYIPEEDALLPMHEACYKKYCGTGAVGL